MIRNLVRGETPVRDASCLQVWAWIFAPWQKLPELLAVVAV